MLGDPLPNLLIRLLFATWLARSALPGWIPLTKLLIDALVGIGFTVLCLETIWEWILVETGCLTAALIRVCDLAGFWCSAKFGDGWLRGCWGFATLGRLAKPSICLGELATTGFLGLGAGCLTAAAMVDLAVVAGAIILPVTASYFCPLSSIVCWRLAMFAFPKYLKRFFQ